MNGKDGVEEVRVDPNAQYRGGRTHDKSLSVLRTTRLCAQSSVRGERVSTKRRVAQAWSALSGNMTKDEHCGEEKDTTSQQTKESRINASRMQQKSESGWWRRATAKGGGRTMG
jgi:hypothetical protein